VPQRTPRGNGKRHKGKKLSNVVSLWRELFRELFLSRSLARDLHTQRSTCIVRYAFVSRERLLLGDIFGKLFLIDISYRSGTIESLNATDLGDVSYLSRTSSPHTCTDVLAPFQTTSPTSILPLTSSYVYLTSRFGDAQLVKLPNTHSDSSAMQEDGKDDVELELLASYPNLAPVLDSCVVGGEGGSAVRSPHAIS
jgi:DNA damage-binding protein 1